MASKKSKKIIKKLIIIYFIYLYVGMVLLFLKDYEPLPLNDTKIYENFDNEKNRNDRAAIIEDRKFALTSRFRLLDEAKESVKILNYGTYKGEVENLFFGKVLQTADRGVKVQIVFDGFVNNLKGPFNKNKSALSNHPNIEIKFYEKPNLLKPWTIHNRLHDKIWIVDNRFALSGGRNIDDRFYLDEEDLNRAVVHDRDVLIFNSNNSKDSSINDFKNYFDEIWNHSFTKYPRLTINENSGEKQKDKLLNYIKYLETEKDVSWKKPIDWMELSYPTENILFVTNPIKRFKKPPIILDTLVSFFEVSEDLIIAQTPYAVLNEELQEYFKGENIKGEFHLLTNSLYSSPNFAAMSGVKKYEDELNNLFDQIYEYQGKGSIHGKSYLIDNKISIIGSFNLDPRSAFLSTENLVIIESEEFNKALYENMLKLVEKSNSKLENKSLSSTEDFKKEPSMKKKAIFSFLRLFYYPYDELL